MTDLEIVANPWEAIIKKSDSFILDEDRSLIDKFNAKASPKYKIQTDLPPEPYVGNPHSADIFLLALNPGYKGDEQTYLTGNPEMKQALLDNLTHQILDYPLFFLNEKFLASPGAGWWFRILKAVIKEIGDDKILLSQKICELQLFPYHSEKYKHIGSVVSSQEYTFYLLRRALRNNKLVILLRSERLWLSAVPELTGKYIRLNNYRNVVLSQNNMAREHFGKLIQVLRSVPKL